MKLVNHPLLFITPLFILGIILGFHYLISLFETAIALCICFLVFSGSYLYNKSKLISSFTHTFISGLTIIALGFTTVQFQRIENKSYHYTHHDLTKEIIAEGVITEKLKPNRYYDNYILALKSLQHQSTTGEVLFSLRKDSIEAELTVGDQVLLKEKLNDVFAPLNPYQFNYQEYLKKRKISKQIRSDLKAIKIIRNDEFSFQKFAAVTREQIIQNLKKTGLEKNQIDLTSALLLGQKKELSNDIYNDFTNAGVVHILAVSGLHVGIILMILNFLFKPLKQLKFGKWIVYFLSILCIWAFAVLVGLSPSVVRAALMFSCLNVGLIFSRKALTFNMLCLSAILMLLWDAYLIFSVGFQMSYLAVLGIISFQPLIKKRFYIQHKIGRYLFDILTVSFCAQLGVIPISIFYFHQFPGLFLLANLLIIPWLILLIGVGILVIIFSFFQSEYFFWIFDVYGSLLEALLWIIHYVAKTESFVFKNIFFTQKMMLSLYLLILCAFLILRYSRKNLIYLSLVSLLFFQLCYCYDFYKVFGNDKFYILHKNRTTVLAKKSGYRLSLYSKDSSYIEKLKFLENFKTELAIKTIKPVQQKNFYGITDDENLLIIDSLAIYQLPKPIKADFVLLSNSPKVNLDRVIEELKPKQIIADGSNYHSYVKRWEATCVKKKVPFHFTGKKGAFIIDY